MKTSNRKVGGRGEDAACLHLMELGHTVLERNWRSGHLEIDIITLNGKELHIVEVKSRVAPVFVDPLENMTWTKRKRVSDAARAYLRSEDARRLPSDIEVLFDVITVVFDGGNEAIEYYPRAFVPIYV